MKQEFRAEAGKRPPLEQAAEWLVELHHESEGTDDDRAPAEWRRWYEDEHNAAEFDGLVEFVGQLQATHRLEVANRGPVESRSESEAARTAGNSESRDDPAEGPRRPWFKRVPVVWGLLAAGVLMISVALTSSYDWRSEWLLAGGQMYQTGVAEQREVVMSDGSRITLSAKSVIKADWTSTKRTIVLVQGEALFNAAHNPTRPFVVIAGRGSIQAVGTAFNVLRAPERVIVTVSEGAVLVRPSESTDRVSSGSTGAPAIWKAAALKSGEEMSYREDGSATPVKSTDPAIALSWRSGRLEYLQQPLSRVIADVNRYWTKQITFDREVGELVYTGDVVPPKIDAWVENLPELFPLVITESDSKHIVLHFRRGAKPSQN